ncbi:YibE/F-like protein [Gleimia coleocanis DSM 15436]|uniref:YibE/F-like protein n=2 Tax=Gleimia TaxID=2692113 RepID=C0W221_9ACTO|nr:YibE/F-like protein [Gleimia coleocanis DSM 15436]
MAGQLATSASYASVIHTSQNALNQKVAKVVCMTHSHSHGPLELSQQRLRKIRIFLTAVVAPLALATVLGMLLLWPSSGNSVVGSIDPYASGTSTASARVIGFDLDKCAPVGGIPEAPVPQAGENNRAFELGNLCAEILDGKSAGLVVLLQIPPEKFPIISEGDTLTVLRTETGDSGGVIHAYWDIQRTSPLWILLTLYLVMVVVVARLRGLAAIAGLTASILVLVYFVMPALMVGKPALLVTLCGVSAMLFASVYFAHGISIRTTTALLGTFGGMALTVVMALWQVQSVHLSGAASEEGRLIFGYLPEVSLQALLVCGIVIAALGALNDVTITQASTVWELHAANPQMSQMQIFAHAMRVGRDHIASTVYTLAFAYSGTALPALLLAMMIDRPLYEIAVTEEIAEEIVRTLIASIGLIISIPLTTLIAAVLVKVTQTRQDTAERNTPHSHGGLNEAPSEAGKILGA